MKQITKKVNRRICDWHDRGNFTVYKIAKFGLKKYFSSRKISTYLILGNKKIRIKSDVAVMYNETISRNSNPTWLLKK